VVTIDVWWPGLGSEAREWLIANNGDVVPVPIIEQIEQAGGPGLADGWWTWDDDSTGWLMPDSATDWIEQVANDETPDVP
jgi:hypothetical protein